MKDPNRDDAFDPLLRQAARGLDAERPSDGCLDADEVAAWADGTLRSSEVARLESHAAACARCRAVMAAMVRTAPEAEEARPAWWKAPVLRWAAPLAAAAAATVIWVNVERGGEQQPPAVPGAPAVDQAPVFREPTAPQSAQADSAASQRAAAPPQEKPEARARRESFEAKREDTRAQAPAAAKAEPVPSPAVEAVQERALGQLARDALVTIQPLVLVSPDASIRWRVRPGVAERSADAGATWEAMSLPVQVPLTAGQCVTAEACWLAGAAGTVLRTIDGRTWTAVTSPASVDITSLSASSPLHASVTTADGRTFVTTDGGQTWR